MRCRELVILALLATDARADDRTQVLADHFYTSGEYYRAITAYEELALFATDDATKLRAAIRIAMSYHKGHQTADAVAHYRAAIELAHDPELARTLRIQLALARVETSFDAPGSEALDAIAAELTPSATDAFGRFELARIEGLAGRRDEATRTLHAACVTPSAVCSLEPALARALEREPDRRHPWLGVAFSAVLPGSGSLYGGHLVDGLYYFALTALPALGAYDVHDGSRAWTDQKVTFYGLAGVAAVFYVTNLVSAYIAVSRHNAVTELEDRRALWRETETAMPLDNLP